MNNNDRRHKKQFHIYNTLEQQDNLNDLKTLIDDSSIHIPAAQEYIETPDTMVYFSHLDEHLIRHIKKAEVVLGCVAWLTHSDILNALQGRDVAIVVQKEDFLRPDMGQPSEWKTSLRHQYNELNCSLPRYFFPGWIGHLCYGSDGEIQAVRCVGNHNRDKKPAFPRMHNKFLLFGKYFYIEREDDVGKTWLQESFELYGVWTGSFNLTKNAINSFENAVYMTNPDIIDGYYQQWSHIFSLSEPLDWETDWMAPEWRIGS